MKLTSGSFAQGGHIPARFAFGKIGPDGSTVQSENLNPELAWADVPAGTRSFVIACLDDDVPTDRNALDASGELPAYQPRRRFVHWVQVDVPANVHGIPEGALADKLAPGFGRPGINDYSRGEAVTLGETGSGYDGPCPPYFDARWHTYRFMVIALDVEHLPLPAHFTWAEVEVAMACHVLGTAEWLGIYTLNPRLASSVGGQV